MPKPRRDDLLDVRLTAFDARGRAVGESDGYRVRLRRGVPGSTVRARVLRRRRDQIDAHPIETIAASREAVPARCEHAGVCGGCSFQDLAYDAQLAGKRSLVAEAMPDLFVDPVLPAPEAFGYRNKMEFSFGSRRYVEAHEPPNAPAGFALGLHARDLFSKVIDVRACPIQAPAADRILASAREIALELGLSPWDAREHRGLLRHLVVRVASATGEILVALVTSEDARGPVDEFARRLLSRHGEITTLVHGVNSRHADTAIMESERVLHGPGSILERLSGLEFAISAGSFFQTNTRAAEILIALVREEAALSGEEVVWDLYCGTGTLALSLARSAREVVGLEIVSSSVADARRNAGRNGIANARFVEGDVLAGLSSAGSAPPDVVLLDPPRSGLHPKLIPRLAELSPRRIVYVSCNPKAAAADVARLSAAGYQPGRVRPVDLFPHTPHVESVIGFERRSLCPQCAHVEEIVSDRGSTFLLCRKSAVDPSFPKYPPQPVVSCPGFER
jgi:23S rRNA (uracil1939-C5)-methyltransferase